MWIIEHSFMLLTLTVFFGFLMAAAVGANDVANAMGASVGAKVLTIKQAIILAGLFEFLGALLASGNVSATLAKDIININEFASTPEILVLGMIAALMAAGAWLIVATIFKWPVSTTHSIVGALIGFGAIGIGLDKVQWGIVGDIVVSWLLTPAVSLFMAFLLFSLVQKRVLSSKEPDCAAIKDIPFYVFLVSFTIFCVTIYTALTSFNIVFTYQSIVFFSILISLFSAYLSKIWLVKAMQEFKNKAANPFDLVEKCFGILAVFTAGAMAFAHGSNDTANAIGPMAAVFDIINNGGKVGGNVILQPWLVFLGAVGVITGLAVYGYRVIITVGTKVTELTPSRSFAAQLATAITVVVCSGLGLPVSTTQILIGALLGVGLARGISSINLRVVRDIVLSWIITLPAGAMFSMLFFKLLLIIFTGVNL